jgi:hypothetical protein
MRMAARKSPGVSLLRRDQMLRERMQSPPLRQVFPEVGHLRIELSFDDVIAHRPSPQQHTLFPAAAAFFRFVCPCTDCDGDFDLKPAVTALLKNATWRKQDGITSAGKLSCDGVRIRDRGTEHKACSIQLNFKLIATPRAAS